MKSNERLGTRTPGVPLPCTLTSPCVEAPCGYRGQCVPRGCLDPTGLLKPEGIPPRNLCYGSGGTGWHLRTMGGGAGLPPELRLINLASHGGRFK